MSQFFVGHFTESVLTLVSEYCTQHFFILERLFLNQTKIKKSLDTFGAPDFFT